MVVHLDSALEVRVNHLPDGRRSIYWPVSNVFGPFDLTVALPFESAILHSS